MHVCVRKCECVAGKHMAAVTASCWQSNAADVEISVELKAAD